MSVTLVNNTLSNELDNSIQLVQVKLGDTILEDVTKSIATNKNYITQIYLNVNSVYKLHLNSILYDYEWETDNNMVSVICNGERKAMILENGTVVLRLSLAIMNEQSNVHLMLRQRSTRTIVFDTLVKQLVAQGDKVVHNKFIIEKLYSKHIESPLFLSNVLGQTEMHQCCVSGDLNELSRLRSTWDTYANCFNMIVCARDHFLRNAFHLAFAFGHLEVTKYLIYRVGVEMASDLLLQRDYFGMTPFHLAAHYRHKQFLSSLCSWMNCYAFAHQATEQVYVPQVSQKTFTPVIVPNASSLSVINLIGDEDCEMSEAKVKVNRKEAPQKRKRESSYAANKKIRKESPKLDNPMVM
jgi:ankyrin repeat protein